MPRKGAYTGRGRSLSPRDIPKHKCVKKVVRTVRVPAGPKTEMVTIYFACQTCNRDMGKQGPKRRRRLW